MQYELRTQVIEPPRNTFTHLVKRYGDRPASRYEEGSIDIQPKENFHYRPLWDPEHELYDETYSDFRLTDPYSFTDPRQYYYAPYVTSRAAMADAVASTLDYLGSRDLLSRLPDSLVGPHGRAARAAAALRVRCPDDLLRRHPLRLRHHDHPVRRVRGVRPDRQRPGASAGSASPSAVAPPSCSARRRPAGSTTPRCRACGATWRSCSWRRTGARRSSGSTCSTASSTALFFTHLDDVAIDAGRRVVQPVRAAPGRLVQGPAQVARRPLQGVGRRPGDRRLEQGAARRDHHRRRSTRRSRPSRRSWPGSTSSSMPVPPRHVETTATTVRDAVAALTA